MNHFFFLPESCHRVACKRPMTTLETRFITS